MIKTFTQNDLIRFIYKETTASENLEIEQAMLFDPEMSEAYKILKQTILDLDDINMEPSDKSIECVLRYSKSINLQDVSKH
jgi:hypothetical protein